MHMNDLTLDELKRNHEQAASASGRYKVFGLKGSAAYYSRMAEALKARIDELEADKMRMALARRPDRLPTENPQPLEQVKIRKW